VNYSDLTKWLGRSAFDIDAAHDAALVLNCEFYDSDDEAETLIDTDLEDAIETAIERLRWRDKLFGAFKVYGYKRRKLTLDAPAFDVDYVLGRIYEDLDDEYGNPDEPTQPSAEARKAAQELFRAIVATFAVWQHEPAIEICLTAHEVMEWSAAPPRAETAN
jgi:hypothetical protein